MGSEGIKAQMESLSRFGLSPVMGGKNAMGDGPRPGGLYGRLKPGRVKPETRRVKDFPAPQKNTPVYDLYSCIRHKVPVYHAGKGLFNSENSGPSGLWIDTKSP
jgi:hypothetical protein